MRMKTILLLLVCFLLSGLHLPTIACPHPDCGSCCYWVSTGPEPDDGYCELMPGADCGDCADCPSCYSCESCFCLWDCTNPFATCCNGTCCNSGNCCDSTTCCPNSDDICCTDSGSYCCESGKTCCQGNCCDPDECEECVDGACEYQCDNLCEVCDDGECGLKLTAECVTDSDCDEILEHCYLCKCICYDCYAWEYVPENYFDPCPECDNEEGGCYSSVFWIQDGYDRFTGGSPPTGEMGLCDNPTKIEQVGYHIYCVDYDTDVDKIVEIVVDLGLDLSTYVDCGACVLTKNPSSCYKCIIDLIIGEIIDSSPCLWVDGCEHCYDWDENCSTPIEVDVVDWGKIVSDDIGFCYPGLDWP